MGKVDQELFVWLKNHYYIENIMSRSIDNPYYNIFIIFICGVICWIASINSIRLSADFGAFVFIYLPLIFTTTIILIYLLSRLLLKNSSWIVTIIGGLLLLLIGILTYFGLIYN